MPPADVVDDAASDSDVSELNNNDIGASSDAVTQLGYAEDPETPLTAESFPSKSGGLPIWLNPENPLDQANCQVCEKPMNLLVQLYTPEDFPEEAYHRTVYVFCCKDGACHKKNWRKCFKVVRSQLARKNQYYSPSSESDSEDEEAEPWQPKKFDSPHLCVVCGLAGPKTCGKCHQEFYCSREHQLVDWNLAGHKQYCCQTVSPAQATEIKDKRSKILFIEKEIVSEPEGLGADGEEEQAQIEFSKEQNGTAAAAAATTALVPAGDEIYENTEVDVDQAFLKFQLKVQLYPEQVLRYTRTEYGSEDAEPLWVSDKGKPDAADIPACDACGAERTFEFQILSTLLNYLGVSHVATDSLDWGSLFVYTCKDNCPTQSKYLEEVLWKQDFSDEGVQLPTRRPDAVRADQ